MCKKLIILCVALVVVGLSVPALAVYIGFDLNNNPGFNPLKVDLDGGGTTSAKYGWQGWLFARSWTGPIATTFVNPLWEKSYEVPTAELDVYEKVLANPQAGGLSRDRSGGFAGVSGSDAKYGAGANCGYGMTYMKLTLDHLAPETNYRIYLWSYEARGVWSTRTDNPNSKFGVWSTTNPKDWLINNGYNGNGGDANIPNNGEPNLGGYGPKFSIDNPIATTESNMPSGLWDLAMTCGGRTSLINEDGNDHLGEHVNRTTILCAMSDPDGNIVLYGWIDPTDWGGSFHMPLNGFMVVPEPATVALLGLGGLALIRRRKRT